MSHGVARTERPLQRLSPSIAVCVVWLAVVGWAITRATQPEKFRLASLGFAASVLTLVVLKRAERIRWIVPARDMAVRIKSLAKQPAEAMLEPTTPDFAPLARSVNELRENFRSRLSLRKLMSPRAKSPGKTGAMGSLAAGLEFENAFSHESGEFNLAQSWDYSTVDMVNRLDPAEFFWVESSPAEQNLLGWTLGELRSKSFLEVVHAEDRRVASATLRRAIDRGEALGQVVRVVTASGETRDIELNVGARYDSARRILNLRCHLTDITEKVLADREMRHRTVDLSRANEQLLRINRELEELKDRYRDLYQNAPAMYFTLDAAGMLADCNQTLLNTLKWTRDDLVGQPYERLLSDVASDPFRNRFEGVPRGTSIEIASRWRKSDGEKIEVWISASLVRSPNDKVVLARCVAQDVTTRFRLEAELHAKNESLARANTELSLKNRELDDFVYVVSHDLQEPLRTLIAFSDFLLADYGDRFDDEGRQYVHYLTDASRRMRAMILALLSLSRAGKVIGGFIPVDLQELVEVIRTDLGELTRAKGADIRMEHPLPVVWGDRNRLTQMITSLLVNGLKYNHHSSPVVEVGVVEDGGPSAPKPDSATAADAGGMLTLYFRDNGIGIDPEFHRTIFQLFRRLHTQDEYEGTGAGLAICSKIVQAHGGRIWVESSNGQGSTFYVRLRRHSSDAESKDEIVVPPSLTVLSQDRADESNSI